MISARGSTKCASEQMGQPPRAGLCVYITIVGPARRVQKPRPLKCPARHAPAGPRLGLMQFQPEPTTGGLCCRLCGC